MKVSEFYVKYWRIILPTREKVAPELSDKEKAIWDKAEELCVPPYVRFWERKYGWKYIVHPQVEGALKELI